MTTAKRVRLVYGIVLSVSLVLAGFCLMAACVGIYESGDRPFSREAVAQSFSVIAVPVYLALALVIGGFILDYALPTENKTRKPEKNYARILRRLWKTRDLNSCDPHLKLLILLQQQHRKRLALINLFLLVIGTLTFLGYALLPSHFSSTDINGSMIKASCLLFACLAIPFGYAIFAVNLVNRSLKREIEYVKQIEPCAQMSAAPARNDPVRILRWILLCLGVVILIYGYVSGGTLDVLTKAVNICTECVGLG